MSVYNVVLTQLLNYYVSDNETQPVYTKFKDFQINNNDTSDFGSYECAAYYGQSFVYTMASCSN